MYIKTIYSVYAVKLINFHFTHFIITILGFLHFKLYFYYLIKVSILTKRISMVYTNFSCFVTEINSRSHLTEFAPIRSFNRNLPSRYFCTVCHFVGFER